VLVPNASLLVMRGMTLGTVSLDGTGFNGIMDIDPLAGIGRFRWSATGKEIAFTQRLDGVTRVGVLGFDARTRFMPALPVDLTRARVSGDEGWIAGISPATVPANLTASIWRLSADGTMSLTLCAACDFSTSFVEISNDGQRVIYSDQSRVELVDLTTGVDLPLGTATLRARFSPDGTRFAYIRASDGELRMRNADLSGDHAVTDGVSSIAFGSIVNWSSGGNWIVASIGSQYYAVAVSTGLALPLPTIVGGLYVVFDGWRP
jgi:dipeptidyl aminopeptidase/acylaminoacyl peptidase